VGRDPLVDARTVIRISRTQSIPEHYESMPLRPPARVLGWSFAVLAIAGGLVVAAVGDGLVAELLGPVVVTVGGVALAAVWQCRKYELTIGTARIETGTGPFRDTLAAGAVASTARRPATAWRKLFSDEEVVLRLAVGRKPEHAVPTRDPAALEAALPPRDGG
jgi:hypothetical protein